MNVFICYRREDTGGYALAIYRELVRRLGSDDHIFMDIDSIDAGTDFVEVVKETLGNCDVVLVLLGTEWVRLGAERWNAGPVETDLVRVEVYNALSSPVRVIPLLVNQAQMPDSRELPEDIRGLSFLNALEIRNTRFEADLDQLVDALNRISRGESGVRGAQTSTLSIMARRLGGRTYAIWQRRPFLVSVFIAVLLMGALFAKPVSETAKLLPYLYDAWDPARPMGDHEESPVADMKMRVTAKLEAAIASMQLEGAHVDPWVYADALVGLDTLSMPQSTRQLHYDFLLEQAKEDQVCWVQGENRPTDKDSCHLAATAWVLFALAHLERNAPLESWHFLLGEQHPEGWWPLYEGMAHKSANASIFATALLTLSIHLHIDRSLAPDSQLDAINAAVSRSSNWLAQQREQGSCIWPDYPYSDQRRTDILALSGLVTYVLSEVGHPDRSALCDRCLNRFTADMLTIDATSSNSLIEFRFDDGAIVYDTVNHLELVWTGIGAATCYESGGWRQRAHVRAFLSESLFGRSDTPDEAIKQTWILAETVLLLRAMTGQSIL